MEIRNYVERPMPDERDECSMGDKLRDWTTQVCNVLQNSGPLTMAGIARELKSISANEVAMALGWLAQEGRIHFRQKRGMWEAHLDGKKEAERVADLVCGP